MQTYRDRMDPSSLTQAELSTSKKKTARYGTVVLPSRFNITDDDVMNWSENSVEVNTIEDEYRVYSRGPRTSMKTDILKFWEVSTVHPHHLPTRLISSTAFPTGSRCRIPNTLSNCHGLFTNSGVLGSVREGILLQRRD